MKLFSTLLLSLAFTGLCSAEQKFPRGTFESKDLDKAKAEATAQKKPIAFIMTDKDTTCPLCQGAASAFLDVVKSKAVIVYVNSKETSTVWGGLPEAARKGLEAGKFIPKMAVTDASAANLITSINYDSYTADDKILREFKKALKPEK
ncbi:hypothetical protein [Luteolibacter sp. Populi]|uniref:hypothetical protein n=1 Tax=Luteolibacter sp. Populi TaxID=3230487 RepID=UPI00346528D3